MAKKRLYLNLASHPVRNRRLFYSICALLGGAFLLTAVAGGWVFISSGLKNHRIRESLRELNAEITGLERESGRFENQLAQTTRDHREDVDMINGIIYQKIFSWVDLLSLFERALPDDCYLTALSPQIDQDLNLTLRMTVASPDLDNLLDLINRMRSMKFYDIRMVRESRSDNGRYLFELVVKYDRAA